MSNIVITHAPTGLIHAEVLRTERISPHFQRVTLGGGDLARFEYQGFDQWFRLALPVDDGSGLDGMPDTFTKRGYISYLMLPKTKRPVVRNYTVRGFRPDVVELDIDFVVHGTEGVAGPWSVVAEPGDQVAFIDQGCGWKPVAASSYLLVADESGLPAVVGILRDMPRDAQGDAVIEIPDIDDKQQVDAPAGVRVHWVVRPRGVAIGGAALETATALTLGSDPYVFVVGESSLATGLRRWAVTEKAVPKANVTFCGYWKAGRVH